MRSLSDNTRGAILMMAAMAAFSINDAIMKGLVSHINLYQVLFLRGLLTLVLVMTVLTKVTGPVSLRMPKQDRKLVALRSAAEMTASIGIVTALSKMPFANVSAILQSSPLMIALGAALVFRQPIGWRRMLAIGIGFIGVLFIVKPGPDGFEDGVLWVLLGVISVTVRDLSVRGMSSAVSTSTVTLGATLSVTVLMGLISTTIVWDPMTVADGFWIVANAVAITVAFALAVAMMKVGDISFVASFRYTALIWVILIGIVVFGEWPDIWTYIGGAIIAATGIYTLLRERRLAREK